MDKYYIKLVVTRSYMTTGVQTSTLSHCRIEMN